MTRYYRALVACLAAATSASALSLPADMDVWTENSANLWSADFGVQTTISDDSLMSFIGDSSIRIDFTEGVDNDASLHFSPAGEISFAFPTGKMAF